MLAREQKRGGFMATTMSVAGTEQSSVAGEVSSRKGGKGKLFLVVVPVVLALIGAGLWFTGVLPDLLGLSHPQSTEEHVKEGGPHVPVFVELPEMIANLNAAGRRPTFIKLKARVELARTEDQAGFAAAQPRVIDLFQTYLREMRPEEFRGSAGTYRLREELITALKHCRCASPRR